MKLTVKVPQTSGPASDWKVSGFTLAEYLWNDINAIKYWERAFPGVYRDKTNSQGSPDLRPSLGLDSHWVHSR